jgi:DnaJ family protein A protein 2
MLKYIKEALSNKNIMVKDTTLYDRLEITPESDENQIKKAYNKLSKQWHPDKHTGDAEKEQATQKFKEITEAKEILLDKQKRDMYDQMGMDMFNQQQVDNQPFNPFENMFPGGFPFGGMPGMPQGMRQQQQQVENIIAKIDVTLEQLYNEETINFSYKQKISCTPCNGEGTKDGKPSQCQSCNGKGVRVQVIQIGPGMLQQAMSECHNCKGKGKIVNEMNKCDTCNGKCHSSKEKTIQIPLKSGLCHGNKINLQGKGHHINNMKSDLILVVNELSHNVFKRNGENLFIEVELKLYQAMFGYSKIITHLDGRKLHLSTMGKTDFNTYRKIADEGMKDLNNRKGSLYIRFSFILPNLNSLPNETKNQLKLMLQSFDKNEVTNEAQNSKLPNLVKTISTDCKLDQTDELNKIYDMLKQPKQPIPSQFEEERPQQQQQCAHQ